jgi:hypothetical protein
MARPRMIVVAGPPGSGKTRSFPVSAFGIDGFNIDDRCATNMSVASGPERSTRVGCPARRPHAFETPKGAI